jgi:hypothetical protein
MNDKKRFWQHPDWYCLSPRRKYPWSTSAPSDYQDILSTYDCLIPDEDDLEQSRLKPVAEQPD